MPASKQHGFAWLGSLFKGGRTRPRIFLSYRRRGEASGFAGRLADRLVKHFGADQIFRDVEDIASGVDFVDAINEGVEACEALLVVIGPDWLTVQDASGRRRLDDPRDFVRLEVASALRRSVRVIPVLVCGAQIPAESELPADIAALSRRQTHELSDKRWDYDVDELVKTLESIGIPKASGARGDGAKGPGVKKTIGIFAAAGVGAVVLAVLLVSQMLDNAAETFGPELLQGSQNPQPQQQPTDVKSAASVPETQPAFQSTAAEQEVRDVVARSAQARIFAQQSMDPQALDRDYTGVALQFLVGQLQYMASQGVFAISELHDQTIQYMQISPDGLNATVELEETWSAQFVSVLTRQCASRYATHTVPHRLYLTRMNGLWQVHSIELPPNYSPVAVPCY
jgi:hypothetical protein